jgi:hypothetical protein
MNKLTEAELAERKATVMAALERNPDLTMHHFRQYGYSQKFLETLKASGVKFGKRKVRQITIGSGKGIAE